MLEGSGLTVADDIGPSTGNNINMIGNEWLLLDTIGGLSYDGDNDFTDTTLVGSLDNTLEFSLLFHFKFKVLPTTDETLIGIFNTTEDRIFTVRCHQSSGKLRFALRSGTTNHTIDTTTSIVANQLYSYGCSISPTEGCIYLDSVQENCDPETYIGNTSTAKLIIGARSSGSQEANAEIYDPRIYKGVLTQGVVNAHNAQRVAALAA